MALIPILVSLAIVVALPLLYIYLSQSVVAKQYPTLSNKRICLLIAHPDDEAMFFAPSLLALTRPETGNHVKILCLSKGDAEGLGETRRQELVKSALMLGLRQEDDIFVIDSPDFPDSMKTNWDAAKISELLSDAFAPWVANPSHPSSPKSAKSDPTASIDVLLTFDAAGVSGHPNHTSLHHGARAFISALTRDRPADCACPVDLYTLTSVNLARKFTSFLDVFATLAELAFLRGGGGKETSGMGNPAALVSCIGLFGGRESAATARRAMTSAHVSQMVWFRWGWISLSRYMLINDLRLERSKS